VDLEYPSTHSYPHSYGCDTPPQHRDPKVALASKAYFNPVLSSGRGFLQGIFTLHILELIEPIVELLAGIMFRPV